MKKNIGLATLLSLISAGVALAGPHAHGPFLKHKSSGRIAQVPHNPNKPGPGSFHVPQAHHPAK